MSKNLLTVIIPMYNAENSIKKTVKSIQDQSEKNINILIIDDGSKDNSKMIVNELMKDDPRIVYFYQENGGVSKARNTGIDNTHTKYLSFLDADDLYEKDFAKKMLEKIESEKTDLVACGYERLTKDGKSIAKTNFKNDDFLYNYIMGINKLDTASFLISTDLVKSNRICFTENFSWGEDIEFFTKVISKAKSTSLVEDYLTVYKIGFSENALSNFSIDKIDKDKAFVTRILEDKNISLTKREREAFINYRLPGLIVYKLLGAIQLGYPKEEIKDYYKKYLTDINKYTFSYGLRSIKLFLNVKKLGRKIEQL